MANGLAKQTISLDPKDHDFFVHKERDTTTAVHDDGSAFLPKLCGFLSVAH